MKQAGRPTRGSNPRGRTNSLRPVPDTWVTVYSGDMGNTLVVVVGHDTRTWLNGRVPERHTQVGLARLAQIMRNPGRPGFRGRGFDSRRPHQLAQLKAWEADLVTAPR